MATVVASDSGGFTTNAAVINSTSVFVSTDIIAVPEKLRGRPVMINGAVGAADAIGHMTLTGAALPGGTHADLSVDPDGTTSNLITFATTNSFKSAASGVFVIILRHAPSEFALKAKKVTADTTLTVTGCVLAGG